MYVEGLADLSDDQIRLCIGRAMSELRWFPKPAELRELAGAAGSSVDRDAESRKAWEVVLSFAAKWVQSDPEGCYVISRGVRSSQPPQLSQQILDTVHRTGGWRAYKTMSQDDYPHQQNRFSEEYAAWAAVEQIVPSKLLMEMPKFQLVAKPMEQQRAEVLPTTSRRPIAVKRETEPRSPEQVRESAIVQKRALADWQARRLQGSTERPSA
jgi:hypothetical protein